MSLLSKSGYHWSKACNAWLPNSVIDTYMKEKYTSPYLDPASVIGAHLRYNMTRNLPDIPADLEGEVDKILQLKPNWEKEMLQLSENDRDTQCHAKAKARNQRTFTLVEQDITTPVVICEWIKENIHTAPLAKLQEALESAHLIANSKIFKKHAD